LAVQAPSTPFAGFPHLPIAGTTAPRLAVAGTATIVAVAASTRIPVGVGADG